MANFRYRESRRTLSLPLSPGLDDQDVEDVITAVRRVAAAYSAY